MIPRKASLRKYWYGLYVNRLKKSGRFVSKKYKGEEEVINLTITMPIIARDPVTTTTRVMGRADFNVSVTLTLKGSGSILHSLFFLAGADINYTALFKENMKTVFSLVKNHALRIIETGEGMAENRGNYVEHKQYQVIDDVSGTFILPYKQSWGSRYTEFVDPNAAFHPLGILSGELYQGVKNTYISGALRTTEAESKGRYKRWGWSPYLFGNSEFFATLRNTNIEDIELAWGEELRSLQYFEPKDFMTRVVFDRPEYIGYVHEGKERVTDRPFLRRAVHLAIDDIDAYLLRCVQELDLEDTESLKAVFFFNDEELLYQFETEESLSKMRGVKKLLYYGEMLNPRSKVYKSIWKHGLKAGD